MASSFPNTLAYLNKFGSQVENEIETRLYNAGKVASGNLYDSIGFDVKERKNEFSISFRMADYGEYVDKGIKPSKYANSTGGGTGKSPFIKSLMKWCEIKGLPKNAAFPIRRKIWRDGIPATNFFTIPTRRRLKQLNVGFEKAYAKDVELNIQKELKKNGYNKKQP